MRIRKGFTCEDSGRQPDYEEGRQRKSDLICNPLDRRKQRTSGRGPRWSTAACWFVICASYHWIPSCPALAPPPHFRACPGPLDMGDISRCGQSGNVSFSVSAMEVALSDGRAYISVVREGGFSRGGSVQYDVANISAFTGVDFETTSGSLSWTPSDGQPKVIEIPLINSGIYSAGRYITAFRISLRNPTRVGLGAITEAQITIINSNAVTGTIDLADSAVNVDESDGSVSLSVTRTGGSDCNATVSYRTVAVPGFDFGHYGLSTPDQTGTVNWPEGDGATKTITIPITDDEVARPSPGEQFYVELYNADCAPLGNERTLVTVFDNDEIGFLQLDTPSVEVFSDSVWAYVTVSRVGGSTSPISVDYFTVDGTATAGNHYRRVTGQLVWQHGDIETKSIAIRIFNNAPDAGAVLERNFVLELAYVTGTSLVGSARAAVTIYDVLAQFGRIGFQIQYECTGSAVPATGNCYYFREDESVATLVVTRTGGLSGAISVDYVATNVTTSAFNDFQQVSGTLTWPDLDMDPQYITIPIQRDAELRPIVEFMQVTLVNPSPLASVLDASRSVAYVGAIDQDGAGSISISTVAVEVLETDGVAYFSFNRSGLGLGVVSVFYETQEGTAEERIDFVRSSGNVTWADGDVTQKIVAVELVNDFNYRFGFLFKEFSVAIVGSTNNTFVDPREESATVTIVDNNAQTGYVLFSPLHFDALTGTLEGSASYRLLEGTGDVTLTIKREAGLQGSLRVRFRTVDGTASSGVHYEATSGQLVWLEGDDTPRYVTVPVIDDSRWSPRDASTSFSVVIYSVEVFQGGLVAFAYPGPANVTATITIEEDDGPGLLRFTQTAFQVLEDSGSVELTVARQGGADFDVYLNFSTQSGAATAFLAEGDSTSLPFSCDGASASGVRKVRTAMGVREVYCDVSGSGSSASMLVWDQSTLLWERECTVASGGEGVALWSDLAARVLPESSAGATDGAAAAWTAAGGLREGRNLTRRPEDAGSQARPVPFPLNERVVWFDWQNRRMLFTSNMTYNYTMNSTNCVNVSCCSNCSDGLACFSICNCSCNATSDAVSGVKLVSFHELGISGAGGMDRAANDFYFISDGISTVHVGTRQLTGGASGGDGVLVAINWTTEEVAISSVPPLNLSDSSWCSRPADAFGHLLWTVNGRVLYRDCSASQPAAGLGLVLGGPIHDPSSRVERIAVSPCPGEYFDDCGGWAVDGGDNATGLDLFASVDGDGFLHLGVHSAAGGLFSCGGGGYLGTVRTGIELVREVADDYVPVSGGLTWNVGDRSNRTIVVPLLADGRADSAVFEDLQVLLFSSVGATLLDEDATATITIEDVDGPGRVTVTADNETVAERGACCYNCDDNLPDRTKRWCADITLTRSSPRGPLCVDLETVTSNASMAGLVAATPGVHFAYSNTTVCWAHGDMTARSESISLLFHPTYDTLFKTITPTITPAEDRPDLPAAAVSGASFLTANGAVANDSAVVVIEDGDAITGVFSFVPDPTTGFSVFGFSVSEDSAIMSIGRYGGSDTNVELSYRTEFVLADVNDLTTELDVPIPVTITDGSRGSNVFCLSNDVTVVGPCADSSSSTTCDSEREQCTAVIEVAATQAVPLPNYNATNTADYRAISGTIRWPEGDTDSRGVSVPLFHPVWNATGTIYRVFRVVLSSPVLTLNGRTATYSTVALPGGAPYGPCDPIVCKAPTADTVIGQCDTHSCRDAATSEGWVVKEVRQGAGNLRLVNTSYFIPEGLPTGTVALTVQRVGGSSGNVSVQFVVSPLPVDGVAVAALPEIEFGNISGVLQWADGDNSEQLIEVPIPNDNVYTRGRLKRSFAVEIANATGGAVVRRAESLRVVVVVDDDAQPGVVQVLETKRTVSEGVGYASIEVARVGGVDMDIFVKFHTGLATVFSSSDAQTGNSSAHSFYMSLQSYACQTTIASVASANLFTTRRGGGDAVLAFDRNNNTFWDSDAGFGNKWLKYTFTECGLGGVAVSAYTFITAPSGADDGCPAAWTLQGSSDGIVWTTIDEQTSQACSEGGREYLLNTDSVGFFDEYRWVFTADSKGFTGVRIYEVLVSFGEGSDVVSSMAGALMCNNAGECCVFQPGECDIGTGHTYPVLEDVSHDFEYSQGLLHWPEGDNSTRNLSIAINDDCMACANGNCAQVSQLQDKPQESFTLTLSLASDVEIRDAQGNNQSTFPFRQDANLHESFFQSVITIQDDDGPGVLALWTASCGLRGGVDVPEFITAVGETEGGNVGSCAVLETARVVSFVVTREGSARGAVSVAFVVEAIDAIPGVDFGEINGTLQWSHGDNTPKSFDVQILPTDGYTTGRYERRIRARLVGVNRADGQVGTDGGAEIRQCSREVSGICVDPARQEMIVTILDVDAVPGTIVVDRSELATGVQYPVDQREGTVTITVSRSGGDDLPLEVQYETVEVAEQARACANHSSTNCEFDPVQGNLSWADGDTSSRNITISIRSGVMRNAFETFTFRVSGQIKSLVGFCAGFGVSYVSGEDTAVSEQDLFCNEGIFSEATVTIRESDSAGYIQLDRYDWPPVVLDSGGLIILAVDRVEGDDGIVSVQYGTQGYPDGGFAIANTHFIEVSDTVSWSNLDTNPKTISISVLSGSVPTNSIVDLTLKLTASSSQSDIRAERSTVRIVIQSSSFTQGLPTKTVTESSTVQGQLNTISIGLESNSIIGPGGQVTLSGLTGTLTENNAALPVLGSASEVFGGSGVWVQSSGALTLTVAPGYSFEYDTVYTIDFVLQNPLTAQPAPIIPTVAASGNPGCARPSAAGLPLSCPGSISIAASAMSGAVLQASLQAFSSPSVHSRLCLYEECPHSPLRGARNYITISFSSPVQLAAGSTITVTGLTGSSTSSGNLNAIVGGMTVSFGAQQRQSSLLCVCTTPLCSCEVEFEEIPPVADVKLRLQLQCNSLGWGALGGDSIYVRVGTSGLLSEAGGTLIAPGQSCEDNCSVQHDLLDPEADVASFVTSTGRLFVAIHASSHVDFCGSGEYLRANATVTWQTESTDLTHVNGTFDQQGGTMTITIPTLYSAEANDPITMTFPVRNPLSDADWRSITMNGLADSGTTLGTTAVNGSVMYSSGAAEIKFASISESNQIQSKLNDLTVRLETGSVLGGHAEGVWVIMTGLQGAAVESSTETSLPVAECGGCPISAANILSLANFAGDPRVSTAGKAVWDASLGTLKVLLRGQGPTYLIEAGTLSGVVTVKNSGSEQGGSPMLRVSASGALVDGVGDIVEQPLHSGGVHQMQPILRANISTKELSDGSMAFSDAVAYVSPSLISVEVLTENGMQPSDLTTWRLPGLTTCLTLFDNATDCTDISVRYLDAPNGSDIAGGLRNALLGRWDEAARQLVVEVQQGRAVCPGSHAMVAISGADHDCAEYTCGLKVLPSVTERERGETWVSTDGLDCGTPYNPFCDAAEKATISRVEVQQYPGAFWGQQSGAQVHEFANGSAAGRAWFAAAEHQGRLLLVGGIGPEGFVHTVHVSLNGASYTNLSSTADTLGDRAWFPTVSHDGFLWALGGHRGEANSSLRDVWRSSSGIEWCEVTASAGWAARHRHAALSFQGRLWIIGGQQDSFASYLSDVWFTDDGGTWDVATRTAAFAGRAGHAAATHAGRMWVYGGDAAGSDVWASTDGVLWLPSTLAAGWGSPRNLDSGLVFDGRLWVVGGYNQSEGMTDVWWSTDGVDWTRSTAMAQWGQRHGAKSVAFNNRMWVLGGAGDSSCANGGVSQCSSVQTVQACDGVYTSCGGADVWLDAFGVILFTELEVQASSNVFAAENRIHVKAVLDGDLYPGSVVVLSGLDNVAVETDGVALSGPSARAFGSLGSLDSSSGNASLVVELLIPARSEISLTIHVRNAAGFFQNTPIHLAVESKTDKFAITRGSAWTWIVATETGGVHTVAAETHDITDRTWDGGVMMDVVAKRSLLVDSFRFSVPEQPKGRLDQVVAEVYYKEGEHTRGMRNLSEWRSLGSALVTIASNNEVALKVSDLLNNGDSVAVGRDGTCVAQNFMCSSTCTSSDCECDEDSVSRLSYNGVSDARSFEYPPYTFCVNETYCSYDNHVHGACVCTSADPFACVADEQSHFQWLGARPTWVEETAEFMSSTLDRNANISGVLAQSADGFWHSGNGSDFGHESGCVHLPLCDDDWPYNVNQWLSFDLGTEYTLAAFRTLYPNFTEVPDYFFFGRLRTNIDAEDWSTGQFKDFEVQTSARGPSGPWVSVLRDTAAKAAEGVWQTFTFEPVTSRYWRLLFKTNYGYGYMALKALEFYGSASVWDTESEWCQRSLLCHPAATDPVSIAWDSTGAIRDRGLQLSVGTHSFYLRTNIGVQFENSDARIGDVHVDDGRLAVKVGSVFDGILPAFSWESGGEALAFMASVDAQKVSPSLLNGAQGFVVAARFQMSEDAAGGTLFSIGEHPEQAVLVRVANSNVEIIQGSAVLNLTTADGTLLASSAEYCLSAEFLNGRVRVRIQGLFADATADAREWNQTFVLDAVSEVGAIVVGARDVCGVDTFDGAMLGLSVYAGQVDASVLDGACRRKCSARQPDGSCYQHLRVVEEQKIETNAASDMDVMMLPAPPRCYTHLRLRVTESSSTADWCIAELVLFHETGPEWAVADASNATVTSKSDDGLNFAVFAVDGDKKPEDGTGRGGGEIYCSAANETSGWIELEFANEVCLAGYAILALGNGTEGRHGQPSTWALQGSADGVDWHLLDHQGGITWQQHEWKRFRLDEQVPYMFVSNLFDSAREFGYNTLSRLYRWIGEDEGWVLDQEIPTRGARAAVHFEIGDDHFIAVSETKDSTVIASARDDDGRVSDSQVGSDIFRWTRDGFVVSDSLSTNISLSMTHFSMGGEDYLVSADHRRVVQAQGEDEWASIVFKKEKFTRTCETEVCPRDSLCGCRSCACGEFMGGSAISGGASVGSDPAAAFDGDDATLWVANFIGMAVSADVVANVSRNLTTNASIVALEYNFEQCTQGVAILGYALQAAPGACASEWALQGSWDGNFWDELDHQAEQKCSGGVKTYLLERASAQYARIRWVFVPPLVNDTYLVESQVEIREASLMFANQDNRALLSQGDSRRSFDFSQRGPPFQSIGRDSNGYPVSAFRTTDYEFVGNYGTFDLALLMGTERVENCSVGGVSSHDNLWSDPLAPFGSCATFSDLCDPSEYPICFGNGTSMGLCATGPASGSACDIDDDCGVGGYCAVGRRYAYRLRFKQMSRLILIRIRGCGWCGGLVRVRDANQRVVAERDFSSESDCDACREFKLSVLRTGKVFYIEDANAAPLSLRASISFDYEFASDWDEHQLLPTTHAQDFEFFVIANHSYLAVANFRGHEPCYGSISCVNPRRSISLVSDTALPFNIDSFVYKHNGSSFELHQKIPTRGAVDWEHFMLSGAHYICVANSFDAEFSSSRTTSVIYAWNGTAFTEWQHIETHGARSCKYFEFSGRHHLLLANSYDGASTSLESAVYVWDGSTFVFAGGIPSVGVVVLTPYQINNALYVAVANRFDGSRLTLNSTIQRVHDAIKWKGMIEYSDAFLPSATFVVRQISDTSVVRDNPNNITVSLQPDRDLPLGCQITITGLVGTQTATGAVLLTGDDASLFTHQTGTFDAAGSFLVLETSEVLPSSRSVVFSFTLVNGLYMQEAVQPRVEAAGSASIAAMVMDGAILQVSQVDDVALTLVSASETSAVRGSFSNTLTLLFRPNTDLPAGSFAILEGLINSPTVSGPLELSGSGVSYLGSSGSWVQESGTLNLTVVSQIDAFITVQVSFTLANPTVTQAAVFPVLSVSRPGSQPDVPARSSDNSVFAANIGASFVVKEVGDSTTLAGISNTIFITIQPATALWEDTQIIVGSLLGASTLDGVLALDGPHKNRFVDERASFSAESRTLTLTVGPNCNALCQNGDCLAGSGTPCVFPFVYEGVERLSCIATGSPDGSREWCGTTSTVSSPISNISAGWGYCDCKATIPADSTTIVAFDLNNPLTKFAGATPTIKSIGFEIPVSEMTADGGAAGPLILASTSNISSVALAAGDSFVSSKALPSTYLSEVTIELWLLRSQGSAHSLVAVGDQLSLLSTATGLALEVNASLPKEATLPATLLGVWTHVAVTWTASTGRVVWYVDGVLALDQSAYVNNSVIVSSNVTVGDATSSYALSVSMVRVWTVARNDPSSPSIRDLYDKVLMPLSLPNALIVHYAFDSANSNIGYDSSRSALHLAVPSSNVEPILRTTLALEGFTYPGVTLESLTATSVGTDPGGDVCISIAWETSQDLGAGAVITVSQLHDLQTLAPVVPLASAGQPFALAPYAQWDRESGQLSLELEGPVQATAVINFTVTLINSLDGSNGRHLQVSIQDGTIRSYGDEFRVVGPTTARGWVLEVNSSNATCDTASASVPYWTNGSNSTCPLFGSCIFDAMPPCSCLDTCPTGAFRQPASLSVSNGVNLAQAGEDWVASMLIGESATTGGVLNVLSVTLQPDRDIAAGSKVIIAGLTGSLTGDRTVGQACAISGGCFLTVAGPASSGFEVLVGSWEQAAGRLTLTLSAVMQSESPFVFSFQLQNSVANQSAVTPTVEVTGPVWIPPAPMCGAVMGVRDTARRLLVKSVSESTCVACKSNTVTVTLQPSVHLAVGDNITITNLTESLTPSGKLQLSGPDAFYFKDGLGTFEASSGTVELQVGVPVNAEQVLELYFVLHNGQDVQDPRVPKIKLETAGHDVSLHGPIDFEQADGIASFSFGGIVNSSIETNSSGSDAQRWLATGWATQSNLQTSSVVWLEKPEGSCCVGSCCPAGTCCSCSSLAASGLDGFEMSGVYFEGSPCEVVCDMSTSGGGWTLASVHVSGGNRWAVHPNASDKEDLQQLYATANMWEDPRAVFGDWRGQDDARTWAFSTTEGDGRGAGEQVMITLAEAGQGIGAWKSGDGAGGAILLQTEGYCVANDLTLSAFFASLDWNCSSVDTVLGSTNRSEASHDTPTNPDDACAHACVIATSNPVNETALLGGSVRQLLFFKAGANFTASNESVHDRVYLSTELRTSVGDGTGLGVGCSADFEACGQDIAGAESLIGLRYAVWVRRIERWENGCDSPYYREGSECSCCSCPAGYGNNGGTCVQCPVGKYKTSPGTAQCEPCGGSAGSVAFGEGSPCGTIEIWISTRPEAVAAASLPVSVSVLFQETGNWSDFLVVPPVEGQPADSTARLLTSELDFVGTPAAVRYRLPSRGYQELWWPMEVSVRANDLPWFSTNSTLCPVDAVCDRGCEAGRHYRGGLLMDNTTVLANCTTVYRTSLPELLFPLSPDT